MVGRYFQSLFGKRFIGKPLRTGGKYERKNDMMQRMNCNYVTEIYKSEELQHKVKVLERAVSHLAHDFNGQQFYIYAQSDTDEETYEKFIQRAEKELELEKGE